MYVTDLVVEAAALALYPEPGVHGACAVLYRALEHEVGRPPSVPVYGPVPEPLAESAHDDGSVVNVTFTTSSFNCLWCSRYLS